MRIHLDPNPVDGGGSDPAQVVAPVAVVADPVIPPINPNVVQVSRADHDATVKELAEFRTAKQDSDRAAREAQEERLRKDSKWEKIVEMRDDEIKEANRKAELAEARAKQTESASASYVRDDSLSRAIAGRTDLAEGAAELLTLALSPHLDARQNAEGKWVVSAMDGKNPTDFLAAYLAQPKAQLLLKAGSKPGPDLGGGSRTATPVPDAAKPKNLGEAIILANMGRASAPAGSGSKYNRIITN